MVNVLSLGCLCPQMVRTRATAGRGQAQDDIPPATGGRGRARARGGARGARRAAPARGDDRALSPEPAARHEDQVPPEVVSAPLLQDTLLRVLGALESLGHGGTPQGSQTRTGVETPEQREAPAVQVQAGQPPIGHGLMRQPPTDHLVQEFPFPGLGDTSTVIPAMSDEQQRRYERFRKMDPPLFHGSRDEDPFEFITTCHELLQSVGMVQSHGVDYVVLQLRDHARQWWRSHISSGAMGSGPITWAGFTQAFMDRYVSSSVRDRLRHEFDHLS